MKRILSFAACIALLSCLAISARADVIGYTQDTENFPNMLTEHETCGKAYEEFLAVAQPLNACRHLAEARDNLAAQQNMKAQMTSMKNCKDCGKMTAQIDESIAAYEEQIRLYSAQCPSASEQTKLAKKLKGKVHGVCEYCKDKWPGTLGPAESSPCK